MSLHARPVASASCDALETEPLQPSTPSEASGAAVHLHSPEASTPEHACKLRPGAHTTPAQALHAKCAGTGSVAPRCASDTAAQLERPRSSPSPLLDTTADAAPCRSAGSMMALPSREQQHSAMLRLRQPLSVVTQSKSLIRCGSCTRRGQAFAGRLLSTFAPHVAASQAVTRSRLLHTGHRLAIA